MRVPARFFEGFAGTFDLLFATLADGVLAAYLLALHHIASGGTADFADPVDVNFDVPPADAIAYFRSKNIVTRKQFDALFDEARAAAFTVGGLYREDVLRAFKEEIVQALELGTPQREVIKGFRSILSGAGHEQLGEFHLETVFRTNVQVAYGVGRRRAMEAISDELPLWQYSAVLDDRTRPAHRALDGVILPADHPFWQEHYPPWGFSCRCVTVALASHPEGYDHARPNSETLVSYDGAGLPVKAEFKGRVHDFTPGAFKGIPARKGLREVIEEGVRRARSQRA
ncbi:MAG: phage minor head protein [Pyrinomonadaceae bacterium]